MQVIGYVVSTGDGSFLDFKQGYQVEKCFHRPVKTKRPFIFGDESSAKNVAKKTQDSLFAKIFSWELTVKPVYVG